MVFAAWVAVSGLALIAGFQLALAAGMPAKNRAWGGQHVGPLPSRLRVASLIAGGVLYPLAAFLVVRAAGVVSFGWMPHVGRLGMWLMAAFFAIGAVLNLMSRSRPERIWVPVALAVAGCCAVVAISL